jgi:hypothetical protein
MLDLTIEECRALANAAGLGLSDEELQRLVPGINRARRQAAELRALIAAIDEPAGTFAAAERSEK